MQNVPMAPPARVPTINAVAGFAMNAIDIASSTLPTADATIGSQKIRSE